MADVQKRKKNILHYHRQGYQAEEIRDIIKKKFNEDYSTKQVSDLIKSELTNEDSKIQSIIVFVAIVTVILVATVFYIRFSS